MIAKVRRRATSAASGERDGDSVAMARSDIGLSVWQGKRAGSSRIGYTAYMDGAAELQLRRVFDYRSRDTDQYVSAAMLAEAGMVITQA
jgi:hypothetical protein